MWGGRRVYILEAAEYKSIYLHIVELAFKMNSRSRLVAFIILHAKSIKLTQRTYNTSR